MIQQLSKTSNIILETLTFFLQSTGKIVKNLTHLTHTHTEKGEQSSVTYITSFQCVLFEVTVVKIICYWQNYMHEFNGAKMETETAQAYIVEWI